MRRHDREITDYHAMLAVVAQCDCCRIGFSEPDGAYIVPLNFGFEDQDGTLTLYFHGAKEGKKLTLLAAQNAVGFEMDCKHALIEGTDACTYSFAYESVIGKGTLSLLDSPAGKQRALRLLLSHYTDRPLGEIPEAALNSCAVMKLVVKEWSCKVRPAV